MMNKYTFIIIATFFLGSCGESENLDEGIDSLSRVWIRAEGPGTGSVERLTTDNDGNIIVSGRFGQTTSLTNPSANWTVFEGDTLYAPKIGGDVFIWKLSPSGESIWLRQAGDYYWGSIQDIKTDAAGSVYVLGFYIEETTIAGHTFKEIGQNGDFFVWKLDKQGNHEWIVGGVGGRYLTLASGLAVSPEGEVIVTGMFAFESTLGDVIVRSELPYTNLFIWKLNTNGETVWAKKGTEEAEILSTTIPNFDNQGNIVVGVAYNESAKLNDGSQIVSNGKYDILIQKFTSNGELLWAGSGGGVDTDRLGALGINSNGDVLVSGTVVEGGSFDQVPLDFETSRSSTAIFGWKIKSDGQTDWVNAIQVVDDNLLFSVSFDASSNQIHGYGEMILVDGDRQLINDGFSLLWEVEPDGSTKKISQFEMEVQSTDRFLGQKNVHYIFGSRGGNPVILKASF